MPPKKQKKGAVGKNTGGATRKAISAAKRKGATTKSIASASRRDTSTIEKIESGAIKNPPAGLASSIRKAKAAKKKKK